MADEWDVEGVVDLVFKETKLDPSRVYGVAKLANNLFGEGGVVEKSNRLVPGDALLAPRTGLRFVWPNPKRPKLFQVWVRQRISAQRKRWGIGHEIGEWGLEWLNYRGQDREEYCEAISGALNMQRIPFGNLCRQKGPVFALLAEEFGCTETAAALRYGEVTGRPIVVVAWHGFKQRGDAYEFGSLEQLHEIAFGKERPGWRRFELDLGRRVAVLPP